MLDLLNAPRFIETKKERKVVLDRRPWSEEELAILNDVYSCSTKEQIIEALPHRTWDGIKNQAIKLGLKMSPMKVNYKGNASRWTELEFNLLRWFWPSAPMSVMHALLPGRSEKAMIFKASGLGLKRNNQMLPYQVDIIRQVNKLGKVETMKRLPDYTWKQISTYARDKLDITFNVLPDRDMDLLREMVTLGYSNKDIETMLDIAPQIRGRAVNLLGVKC